MKRRSFLEKLLKKTGQFTDEQIADIIDKADEEYPDADAEKVLALLMTEDEAVGSDSVFGKIKGKAKAEVLDPIDAMLKPFEVKLSPEQKTEYGKLGKDSHKKYQFMLKTFDELGTNTGDKNYDDLKTEFDGLKSRLTTDYVPKADYDNAQSRISQREQELVNRSIINAAIRNKRLRDTTGNKHFEGNFVTDAMDLLSSGLGEKKVKGVYNAELGKVMRADSPDQPLLLDGKAVTLDTLADLTITGSDWEKKTDANPSGDIRIPAPAPVGGLSAQQRRDVEQR